MQYTHYLYFWYPTKIDIKLINFNSLLNWEFSNSCGGNSDSRFMLQLAEGHSNFQVNRQKDNNFEIMHQDFYGYVEFAQGT